MTAAQSDTEFRDGAAGSWSLQRSGGGAGDPAAALDTLIAQAVEAQAPLQPLHLIDEITHRVVNEYTEAICALGLAAAKAPGEQAQAALASAAGRLPAQVEAHRALQASFADGPLDLADYLAGVCARLARAPLAETGVRLALDADEIWLDPAHCWRVGLIVAELIRNAARHGLAGRAGHIRVEIGEACGRVVCEVRDDGRGRAGASGRGRRLIQALAADLGGSVDWAFTTSGSSVRLSFASSSTAPFHTQLSGSAPTSSLDPAHPWR
jgi:two-component sensor histidine kinase